MLHETTTQSLDKRNIDCDWARLPNFGSEEFKTKTGKQFMYTSSGEVFRPS